MNILILNQYGLPRGASGITRHGDLGASLAERGHQVTVMASRFNYLTRRSRRTLPGAGAAELHSGVAFHWLETGTYAANDHRRAASMLAYCALAILAGMRVRPKPDLVLASSPNLLAGLAGAIVAAARRIPFVFEVRDVWPAVLVDLGAVRRGGLVHRLLEGLERWLYRRARLVIFVPPDGARRLAELGVSTPSVHVPNASNTDGGRREPLPAELDAALDAAGERVVIMYAGAHGVANSLPTVVHAASELRRNNHAAYAKTAFIFVGDGAYKAVLQRLAAAEGHEQMFFHGTIPKATIPTALARADVLLVSVAAESPQKYGLSPNKLFDYIAAGRPVLISAEAGTVVDAVGCGIRYRPGDATSLAAAIERMVTMYETERQEMGRRGRDAVGRSFSIPAVAGQLEAHLAAVLRR